MATILDLFKKQNTQLYGTTSKILIETKGAVDIPKKAALLTSSPNTLADLIGNQIGGALGGNANRPSDTIFKNDRVFAKPITLLTLTQAQLRTAADDFEDSPAFIKEHPAPGSLIAKIKETGATPAQVLAQTAVNLINNYGSKSGIKKLSAAIKGIGNEQKGYGTTYSRLDIGGKPIQPTKEANFSTHLPVYKQQPNERTGVQEWHRKSVSLRLRDKPVAGISQFDLFNKDILETQYTDTTFKEALTKYYNAATPYVKFKLYGKDTNNLIILPGTISGISEDITPEVTNFKYVGSPFNLYRYAGVERTLKFELKMYFLNDKQKENMRTNLDRIRKLVFPDEKISTIQYNNNGGYSPLVFNPNLVYLTIPGVYNDTLGIVDSLGISIEDNVPWVTTFGDDKKTINLGGTKAKDPYPSVFNVSIGMKIIEHPTIKDNSYVYGESKEKNNIYKNYFTGY